MLEPTEWLSNNAGAFLAFLQGGRDTKGVKPLERDVFRIAIPLYLFVLSVIPAQTRSAFVAKENRYPLFRIMR